MAEQTSLRWEFKRDTKECVLPMYFDISMHDIICMYMRSVILCLIHRSKKGVCRCNSRH